MIEPNFNAGQFALFIEIDEENEEEGLRPLFYQRVSSGFEAQEVMDNLTEKDGSKEYGYIVYPDA